MRAVNGVTPQLPGSDVSQAGTDRSVAPARPSKTQRKQAMHALQEMGEQLLELPAEQWQRLALPELLCDALALARTISAHEARRRQLQYIGRLMRRVDAAAVERALASLRGASHPSVALLHRCEQWRDRLLADDAALTEFLAAYPATDAQALRAMIRAARRERASSRPPRQARLLYQSVHALLAATASAASPSADTID